MTTNYIDKYGRYHVKPVTEANPLPTNNAYIYSFYAQIVGLPVPFLDTYAPWMDKDSINVITEQLHWIDKQPLTRHPKKSDNNVPISHDEYVGVAGVRQRYAQKIIDFGEKNYFQFCDIPGFIPTPFRKLNIDDVMSSYENLANDPETNVRKAIIKYPALYPIAFWHRPEQQYFYYRCAKRSPGIIRTLYFIFATVVSIFKKDKTSPMLGFKFLKLKEIGLTLSEKLLIKLFNRYGKWKEVCKNYFPEDHPILERVLDVKE